MSDHDLLKVKSNYLVLIRSLRRYGFDAQLFSFECGRRCPTGAGIYAFRCAEAEELFNLLQEAINNSTMLMPPGNGNAIGHRGGIPMNILEEQTDQNDRSPPSRRGSSQLPSGASSSCHQYANTNIHNYINSPIYNTPNGNSSGNMRPVASQSLPTTGVTDINTNYAKIDDIVRYYVNVDTPAIVETTNEQGANGTRESVASRRRSGQGSASPVVPIKLMPVPSNGVRTSSSPPSSPVTPSNMAPVNYIQLDLDSASNSYTSHHIVTTAPATPVSKTPKGGEMSWTPPQTPDTNTTQKYAMIDFEKTEALTSASFQRKNL